MSQPDFLAGARQVLNVIALALGGIARTRRVERAKKAEASGPSDFGSRSGS
jgi:hypothetical protein